MSADWSIDVVISFKLFFSLGINGDSISALGSKARAGLFQADMGLNSEGGDAGQSSGDEGSLGEEHGWSVRKKCEGLRKVNVG